MSYPANNKEIRVWDVATRAFHWSLVVMVTVCWITAEAEGPLFWTHLISGYGVLLLVFFRLVWGFLGNRHARFVDFVRGWTAVHEHIKGLMVLTPPRYIGHNPLGGWMILALLGMLSLSVVSGLFAADDGDSGPYASLVTPNMADTLSEIHEALASFLLFLIGLHVLGVLADSLLGRENLARALWTGIKRIPVNEIEAGIPEDDAPESPFWRILLALIVASLALAAIIWGSPG